MVQIKCLGNGLYSLKNSHIPFGQGFQPPPPLTDKDRLNSAFLVLGLPLEQIRTTKAICRVGLDGRILELTNY